MQVRTTTPNHPASPMQVANQAQQMAKNCHDERLALTMQYVAIGSMAIMALAAGVHLVKDMMGNSSERVYRHDEFESAHRQLSGHQRGK